MTGPATTVGMLGTAWAALSGEPEQLPLVRVAGEDAGLLPSRLPCTSAVLAAVSASGLAVSALTAARTGSAPPPVALDAEHVALAARSERYAAPAGSVPPRELFAPLSRFWRTADGWLRLHTNYPWHRERALRVLGCADT